MQELVGNERARRMLARLLESDRVPNALLFAGPDGVGKKQFAVELARSIVCTQTKNCQACSQCSSCKRVDIFAIPTSDKSDDYNEVFFSGHPDIGLVVPFRRNLRVNAIRDLEREANFRPYEARARVFIIDNADMMNESASNALLKTLEEPPSTSHVILVSAREDTLLPTIRSRCQIIRFAPIERNVIAEFLSTNTNLDRDDIDLVAAVAGGSMRRALEIVPASFRTQRSAMLNVIRAAADDSKQALLAASEEMTDAKNKEEFEEKLEILQGLVHDIWLLRNEADRQSILNTDIATDLYLLSGDIDSRTLSRWLGEIETLQENFIVNINRKVATDALFLEMAAK